MTNEKIRSKHEKISFNVSSILESLPPIKKSDLTPTEQKAYLNLSVEFKRMVESTENYLIAANKWSQSLPKRLANLGLTEEEWDRISIIGDNDKEIQNQVIKLIERLHEFDYFTNSKKDSG